MRKLNSPFILLQFEAFHSTGWSYSTLLWIRNLRGSEHLSDDAPFALSSTVHEGLVNEKKGSAKNAKHGTIVFSDIKKLFKLDLPSLEESNPNTTPTWLVLRTFIFSSLSS